MLGLVGAFLPAPFLLLGALRCGQLALSADAPASRHLLQDRMVAATVVGAVAALAASARLFAFA